MHWPLMSPGLIAGAGLIMLATIKELPATLLLAPIEFETLATEIFSAEGESFATKSGLLSLILLSVSGSLTWLLVIRNSE